jgi:asparagine synthase (glutamine-hydrolysing)
MCGITGWVDWERDLTRHRDVLQAMVDSLASRGPDAQGLWLSPRAALGHRRLAVVDVEGGAQPMASPAPGRPPVVLSFSGEIYNHRELRAELAARGHRFRTRSDTEVLLHAYLRWGVDCVARLNGMYAFAVWDGATEELLLARDRLGVKPLYLAVHGSGVVFGSEPKALLATPLVPAEVDAEGLAELLLGATCSAGRGVFRGIRELRPGHLLRARRTGIAERRYWGLTSRPHGDDLPTTVATVRDLLADSVERQTVADVPLGGLLSGGLDSGLVVALAAGSLRRRGGGPLPTFTVDVTGGPPDGLPPDPRGGDLAAAHAVAAHLGTAHTDVAVGPAELVAGWERTIRARDLPGAGEMDVALHLLADRVRPHATVALSGEAADELFGGYAWFHRPPAADGPSFPWLGRGGAGMGDLLHPDLRRALRPREYLADRLAEALAEVPHLEGEAAAERRMRELSHVAITRFLPALLARKDRMSMAAGLEVRVPYADHRLVEYAWNVPWAMRTAGGVAKGLLRRAAAGLLPDAVASRPKSHLPAGTHPVVEAAVRRRLGDLLADPAAPLHQLVDGDAVRAALDGAARPAPGPWAGWWMSRLVSIDMWLRMYRVRLV